MLQNWVYEFLKRNNLVIRTRTGVTLIKAAEMEPASLEFCRPVMMTYENRIKNPMFLMNMDETAVCFWVSPDTNGSYERQVNCISKYSGWFLECYSCSILCDDEDKTATFLYFKGETGRIRPEIFIKHLCEWNYNLHATKWIDRW